jgi:hypothetical protein
MDALSDRLAAWILRSAAKAMLAAGVSQLAAAASLLVAGGPLLSTLASAAPASAVRAIATVVVEAAAVFIVAGVAAMYLSRPRPPLLPNERTPLTAARPHVGGWLIALAFVLAALPVWLVVRLAPFLAEWRRVGTLLTNADLWRGANASMSGLVLMPIAAALTPPFVELATLAAFVVASVLLIALLLLRSRRFPRLYLVCAVLLSALAAASTLGAAAAHTAAQAIEPLIAQTRGRPQEYAQVRGAFDRYTALVASTAPPLAWTLLGYLIWVPPILVSRRARSTFGPDVVTPSPSGPPDLEAVTAPSRFRD